MQDGSNRKSNNGWFVGQWWRHNFNGYGQFHVCGRSTSQGEAPTHLIVTWTWLHNVIFEWIPLDVQAKFSLEATNVPPIMRFFALTWPLGWDTGCVDGGCGGNDFDDSGTRDRILSNHRYISTFYRNSQTSLQVDSQGYHVQNGPTHHIAHTNNGSASSHQEIKKILFLIPGTKVCYCIDTYDYLLLLFSQFWTDDNIYINTDWLVFMFTNSC